MTIPISVHCVRYDPIQCDVDPEQVWQLVQSAGGHVQNVNYGIIDFYVPDRILSLVILMDKNLKPVQRLSYC